MRDRNGYYTYDQNKYRCETCNRRIGLIDGKDDCPIGIPSHIDVEEAYVIEKIGCASHSDWKEQRENVLDEGIDRIQKRINGIFDAYREETNENLTRTPYDMANGMGESILILKELRQVGE